MSLARSGKKRASLFLPSTVTSKELFPEAIRWVLYLNPFTHIVSAYRDFFMYHTLPAMSSVLYMVVMAIICFVLGMFIFRKLEKGFAEEI